MGVQNTNCDRKPIPQRLCQDGYSAGMVAGREGCGMAGLGGHLGWGGVSSPTDCIRGPAEVPTAVDGIHAARHFAHRYSALSDRG